MFILQSHLSTFTDHPTFSAICDCWKERYPDGANFCSFNMRTNSFFSNPKLEIKQASILDIPIWLFKNPTINLDLFYNCSKNGNHSSITSYSFNIIHAEYNNFTLLYTDGSKSDRGTSSALFVPQYNVKQSLAINMYSSVFSAELRAISSALQWKAVHRGRKNLIVTDSYSVSQALVSKKFGKHAVLDEILVLHHTLIVSGLLIHFIRVPSHCGIPGNEIADRLTKVVFRFDPEINDVEIRKIDAKLSYSELKLIIRQVSSEK